MEPTLFRFIFRYSWRQQLILLLLTAASFPPLYASLELPKIIVNKAIGGQDFPKTLLGIQFEQVQYLLLLSVAFLLLVAINGGFKYVINVYKGQLSERMLRRLRYQLYSRVLRFPIPHFRRTSQGELIAMISAEVEPVGGFVGDAIALPAFEGRTLITIIVFMFMQDWVLGLAAISLYPVQMYLIPKLQRQVNALAKQRVRTVRKLSERIGEAVSGIEEVHAHDTSELERADFSRWVGTIYEIRYRIYRKKFFIKFLNAFLGQLTPFLFYSIGGYLVIAGDLTFGALVAVLAAYKDMSDPWKELLNWYQQKEDTRVKYEQLVEQFEPRGLLDERLQTIPERGIEPLKGAVVASNVTLEDESGIKIVDGANFRFEIGEKVALVGSSGSGVDSMAKLLARLLMPTSGSIRIGDENLAELPETVTGRRIGYVGESVTLFSGTIRDNLLYSLKHQPLRLAQRAGEAAAERERSTKESREAGNTESDMDADWIDYEAAGVQGPEELTERTIEILKKVELEPDIFASGLQGTLDPEKERERAERILKARFVLRERLRDPQFSGLVEPFDPDRYNFNMSVAENLLFGTPIGLALDLDHIGENPYMLSVLEKVGLTEHFLRIGLEAAKIIVDLFQGLPSGDEFFERFSFISTEALPAYQAVIRRASAVSLANLEPTDRGLLMALPFKLVPARHRLNLMDDKAIERLIERLLDARRTFAANLPEELRESVAFFEPDKYNPAATVQDNILFGKPVYGRAQSQREVGALITDVINELGLRRTVVELGLDVPVGIGGGRLTVGQRQMLAIARSLLKRPDVLIINQATAALDPGSQSLIMERILNDPQGAGVVWTLNHSSDAEPFDRIIVMEGGRVIEQGLVEDLRRLGRLAPMAAASA